MALSSPILKKGFSMNTKTYLIVSTAIFSVVGVIHLIRFTLGWSVELGTWNVPLWASLLAVVVCAGVAVWGASLARRM
jgi:hypothetical protein